jgi:hypothetical protein
MLKRSSPRSFSSIFRSRSPLSVLFALGVFGCDGRYLLGRAPDAAAGTSSAGQADAGQPGSENNSGTSGRGGSVGSEGGAAAGQSGSESLGGAGASGDGGTFNEAGAGGEPFVDPDPLGRVRWLTVQTFPSSASSQTLLNLVDLRAPTWAGITVESSSATAPLPSPDGRWILYASHRKSELLGNVYDYYVVSTVRETPGERQLFLSDQPTWDLCIWAPDGSRVACRKSRAEVDSDAAHLVLFGTAGATLGSEVDVGPVAGMPVFLGASALAYSNLAGELMRLDWSVDAPAEPTALGVQADQVVVSSDGQRALAYQNEQITALFDVRTGASELLEVPENFALSHSFGAGVSWADDVDTGKRTYSYYTANGLHLSLLGEHEVTTSAFAPVPIRVAERSVVVVDGERLVFTSVPESGQALSQTVPGDYAVVQAIVLDPTGHYLCFSSAEVEGGKLNKATFKHWVSRVGPAGAELPQLLTEGFRAATAVFSPDGKRLLLAGDTYNDVDPQPTPIHLFTLSEGEAPRDRLLPPPLNWLNALFSRDSSYLAFLGGSRSENERQLYALDLLAPDAPARLLYRCSSNPAPLPGCPNGMVF